MKLKIASTFIFFLSTFLFAFEKEDHVAVWRAANLPAQAQNEVFLDIQFSTNNTNLGWACGFGSLVLRTVDGGKTWLSNKIYRYDIQFEHIQFIDDRVGYVSGTGNYLMPGGMQLGTRGFIFKSVDGGATWREITPNLVRGNDYSLWGCYFSDNNNGVVLGGTCNIGQLFYKTKDGGNSWTEFKLNQAQSKLSDAILSGNNEPSYAVGSGNLYISLDNGDSWQQHRSTLGPLFNVNSWHEELTIAGQSFVLPISNGCEGTFNGSGGLTFSSNGGLTWNEFESGFAMFGTFAVDESTAWGVGFNASVYLTENYGLDWELRNRCIPDNIDLDDIWVIDSENVWIAGDGLWYLEFIDTTGYTIDRGTITACKGETVALTASGNYFNNRWSNGAVGRNLTVNQDGVYYVEKYNLDCEPFVKEFFNVVFVDMPTLKFRELEKLDYCEGDIVPLSWDGNYTRLEWEGEPEFTQVANARFIRKTGKYTLKAYNEQGCMVSDVIQIVFHPFPSPDVIELTKTNLCIGDTVFLTLNEGYQNYTWYNAENDEKIIDAKEFFSTESGSFYAIIESIYGCATRTQNIEVIIRPDTNQIEFDIQPLQVVIEEVYFPGIDCANLKLTNVSYKDLNLTSPNLFRNIDFSIPQSFFPIYLRSGESTQIPICFSPRDFGLSKDTIRIIDLCSDHLVEVISTGLARQYSSNSTCDNEVILLPIGIDDNIYFSLDKSYPNPSIDNFTMEFVSKGRISVDLQVFDILGQCIYRNDYLVNNNDMQLDKIEIPVINFNSGVYYIRIKANDFEENVILNVNK